MTLPHEPALDAVSQDESYPANEAGPQFTPGPWKVTTDLQNPMYRGIICLGQMGFEGPRYDVVIFEDDGESHIHELAANAHLIAASPDLYEALAALTRHMPTLSDLEALDSYGEEWITALKALARARGERS